MTNVDLEDLIALCLERIETDGLGSVEDFCREHPAHAESIRSSVEAAVALGLAGTRPATGFPRVPDRVGTFRIAERIGAGGMGIVYRARDESLGRDVALKVLRPELGLFDGAIERFRREAEAAARLRHPGIVPVHASGSEAGLPWIAMELVRGASLAAIIEQRRAARSPADTPVDLGRLVRTLAGGDGPEASGGSRSWERAALEIARRAAEALEHAHEHGVLHRDVKPSNLMVGVDGRVMLLDFGLARPADASAITVSGQQPGSLPYMAPEQIRGDRSAIDARTDVYGLGATLFELLTLRRPYDGDRSEAVRAAILEGACPPPRRLDPTLSFEAEAVCMKAMAPEAARRYGGAAELARDLGRLLDGLPVTARRPGIALRIRRAIARHPARALAAALSVVLLTVVPAAIAWREFRLRRDVEAQRREASAEAQRARGAETFLDFVLAETGGWAWLRNPSEREPILRKARQVLDDLASEPQRRGRLALAISGHLRMLALLREAIEIAEVAVVDLRGAGDSRGEAAARLARGSYRAQLAVDFEAAQEDLEHARAFFLAAGESEPLARASTGLGEIVLRQGGRTDDARAHLAAAADAMRTAGEDGVLVPGEVIRLCNLLIEVDLLAPADALAASYDRVLARRSPERHEVVRTRLEALRVEIASREGRDPGSFDDAIRRIRDRLADAGPVGALVKGELGSSLFRWKRFGEAAVLLRESLAATGEWGGAADARAKFACNLGWIMASEGRHEEAVRLCRLAVELRSGPNGPRPAAGHCLQGLGRSLVALSRDDEAVAALEQALTLQSRAGRPDTELERCRRDLVEALSRRARARGDDRPDDVASDYRRALEVLGSDAEARATLPLRVRLAAALTRSGRYGDAVEVWSAARREAIASRGADDVYSGQVASDLGLCLIESERPDEARAALEDAIRVFTAAGTEAAPRLRLARERLRRIDGR